MPLLQNKLMTQTVRAYMKMSTEESLESCESGHAQCRCLLDVPDAPFVDYQERRQSVDGRFRGYLANMRNHYFGSWPEQSCRLFRVRALSHRLRSMAVRRSKQAGTKSSTEGPGGENRSCEYRTNDEECPLNMCTHNDLLIRK